MPDTSDCGTEKSVDKQRYIKLVRAIVDHGESVATGLAEERPAVTHYMRQQLNRAREELCKGDETLAALFPPIPPATSIADLAAIAQQLIDCVESGPSLGVRAAQAARHGLHITGENVSVMLSDLAELGSQIRDRIAVAFEDTVFPAAPKAEADVDARIQELEAKIKEYTDRIGTDNTPGLEETAEFARVAKELAYLKGRKTRKASVVIEVTDKPDEGGNTNA